MMKNKYLMKLKKSKNEYYVNPDDMWEELNAYYIDDTTISEELGKMIDDIATKLGFLPKFINYSFKVEMQSDARHKMVKAVCDKNFTLWKTSKCTEINEEFGRKYVIIYNDLKQEWDDKKTYLKEWDIVEEIGDNSFKITYKNNPFSYFTKVAYHAFVNRIKKEKKLDEVLKKYQEKVYEDMYAAGNGWENIKRHKLEDEENMYMENYDSDDYDDPFYRQENELEVEIKIDDVEVIIEEV